MGSLCSKFCSKSSTYEGGHTVLGSNTVGGHGAESDDLNRPNRPSDPRAAAAEAAERRAKQAQAKGTKGGKLAKQLAEQNARRPSPEHREEQRLVWD